MVPLTATAHGEAKRMELRALVRLASEIIPYYWPMRTFVHHNPLHGLENLPFEAAIDQGRQRIGGNGYPSNETFRAYYRSGRIAPRHLDAVLCSAVKADRVQLGAREVSQREAVHALFTSGVRPPAEDVIHTQTIRSPHGARLEALARRLPPSPASPPADGGAPFPAGGHATLAAWCDRHLGVQLTEQINRELIKWCAAFLDEGHATWPMPNRDRGFYTAWKAVARCEWSPCAIDGSREKLDRLPAHGEDALLENLTALGIPNHAWSDYFSLHLAALPGWAGFIKWRADQSEYPWQQAHPIDLVQYLAVRLWYERELVRKTCRLSLGIEGNWAAISVEAEKRARVCAERRAPENGTNGDRESLLTPQSLASAWKLLALANALQVDSAELLQAAPAELSKMTEWIEALPESEHGALWLQAFELGYQEQLLGKLRPGFENLCGRPQPAGTPAEDEKNVRPQAQAVFCIDVRSEPFRRQLEAIGDYNTYGFAGFFAVFIRFQALGSDHATDQFPVIMKAKNLVREIPRSYHGHFLFRHRDRARWIHAGHTMLHDLKENVVTPYVMVESLGWFYSLPLIGKTLLADGYRRAVAWLQRALVPPIATTLTVDKLPREEVEEMLAAEQRAVIRRALQEQFGERNLNLSLERLEFLRRRALDGAEAGEPPPQARSTALTAEEEALFVEELRRRYRIDRGWTYARMERIARTGFTLDEQVFTVETALRMMGLTRNLARLVLFCGHGSTSENNPFEAALDCGACGGNPGKPNARLLAVMANRPALREQLAQRGISIPQDTFFIAGQHDTTTDAVELFDLEDLPPTHRKDLLRLRGDLQEAGLRNSRERCGRFPEMPVALPLAKAARHVRRRAGDWSQVRPEWGLSRNAAFIAGRRDLSRGIDLEGRVFLHSYDYREDASGRLLEVVMTGPQVVAQWINMEHYFSTANPEVFGSGSKIYHNVVGRLGIMSGPQSDLRTGLAWQTVMDGSRPYHEPMRLLSLIEAPRSRIDPIIAGHRLLRNLYDNEWVRLIALDPEARTFYRYVPEKGWAALEEGPSSFKQNSDQAGGRS